MKDSCCRHENTKVCQQESSRVLYCAKGMQVDSFIDIRKYEDSVNADGREGKGCNFSANLYSGYSAFIRKIEPNIPTFNRLKWFDSWPWHLEAKRFFRVPKGSGNTQAISKLRLSYIAQQASNLSLNPYRICLDWDVKLIKAERFLLTRIV